MMKRIKKVNRDFEKGDSVILKKKSYKEAQQSNDPDRAIFSFKEYPKGQVFKVDDYYGSNLMVITPDGDRKGLHYDRFKKKSKKYTTNIRKVFGDELPYDSGQRDARNGDDLGGGDSNWIKTIKRLYPEEWKQYVKGYNVEAEKIIKPEVELIGEDGNVFLMMGQCSKALRRAGQSKEGIEMSQKVLQASDYDEALSIMMDYCDIV
jgi:hypothetical protein